MNHLVRAGLVEEHDAQGPEGHSFTVLTATDLGREAGHVPERARADGGDRAADDAKRGAAQELGLHVVNHDLGASLLESRQRHP